MSSPAQAWADRSRAAAWAAYRLQHDLRAFSAHRAILSVGDRPMSGMTHEQAFATSADGTRIAYWCGGEGPRIAFLPGLTATHRSWQPIADRLVDRFRTCTVDRRGRGASGDTPPYAFEREAEDVVAIAEATGPLTGQ